jgi:hypothetical protein
MSTASELATHRTEAGARYIAALTEIRAAYGDLAAIGLLMSTKGAKTPSFGPAPDVIAFRHGTFCPGGAGTPNNALVSGSWSDEMRAAYATRSALYGTPD